jgi:hypothetical protein
MLPSRTMLVPKVCSRASCPSLPKMKLFDPYAHTLSTQLLVAVSRSV